MAGDPGSRFNVVLTNPPFGKKSNYQHIMAVMEVDGHEGVVLPDNILFEARRAGEGIRSKRLLERFKFHTLLRLPTGIW